MIYGIIRLPARLKYPNGEQLEFCADDIEAIADYLDLFGGKIVAIEKSKICRYHIIRQGRAKRFKSKAGCKVEKA